MSSKHPKSRSPVVRWTPSLTRLRALSVRQPWALLIVNGLKGVENRPRRAHHRGPLLIHTASSLDGYAENTKWVKREREISVQFIDCKIR
jgi:ASCH domain